MKKKEDAKDKKLSRTEVKKQLNNLVGEFHKPKPAKLKEPKKFCLKPKKLITPKEGKTDTLQEIIDYLRVCVKYTIWDLEATRRENTYLRKLLEDNNIK